MEESTLGLFGSLKIVSSSTECRREDDLSDLLPEVRLCHLEEYAKTVKLDYNEDPEFYYEVGTKTMTKANQLYKAGDLENAYVFYLKYNELLKNKIKNHPFYKEVSLDHKAISSLRIHVASKKINELRKKLLSVFQEMYDAYVQEQSKGTSKTSRKLKVGWNTVPDKSTLGLCKSFSQAGSFIRLTKEYEAFKYMKTIAIPNQTTTIFQIMVQHYSRHGIISWGYIAGIWENKEYVVTHLIVPNAFEVQRMIRNPESVADCRKYMEENELIALGSIRGLKLFWSARESSKGEDINDLHPKIRLSNLEEFAKAVHLDNDEDPKVYFDVGAKTLIKAKAFYKTGDLENALVFYMKYHELFRNKIKDHPFYKEVSLDRRAVSSLRIYEASLKIKEIKKKLLSLYQEAYDGYVHEQNKGTSAASRRVQVGWKTVSDRRPSKLCRTFSQANSFIRLTKEYEAFKYMKTIAIPNQTTTIFQIMIQHSNRYGIISWGYIAGIRENKEYVVTHLIVPNAFDVRHMIRSPESEADCRKYMKENALIALGWIHVHKSASIYMSFDDLHVQQGIQSELPEAVAIVCAPLLTQVGYYVLSEIGMDMLAECAGDSRPHEHDPNETLYIPAKHIRLLYNHPLEVVDLRKHKTVEKYI